MTSRDADRAVSIAEGDLTGLAAAVFHDIPDAVVCADCEGLIRFWNAGAERIFGFSRDEAVGQSLEIIIPERLRQRHWDAYRRMMETGRSRHPSNQPLSVPAQTKSGHTISIQFTVAPLPGPYGVVAGIVAVLRYATATFQELRRMRTDKRGV
jgi:PAS domain S-box-containing protein